MATPLPLIWGRIFNTLIGGHMDLYTMYARRSGKTMKLMMLMDEALENGQTVYLILPNHREIRKRYKHLTSIVTTSHPDPMLDPCLPI